MLFEFETVLFETILFELNKSIIVQFFFSVASVSENINALINNSIAPNVALTRSTNSNSLSDAQLSPGFSPNLMQQQLSPGQRNTPLNLPPSNNSFSHSTFFF